MTEDQRVITIGWGLSVLAMVIYPPFYQLSGTGGMYFYGYQLIISPKGNFLHIGYWHLGFQIVGATAAALAFYLANIKDKSA